MQIEPEWWVVHCEFMAHLNVRGDDDDFMLIANL